MNYINKIGGAAAVAILLSAPAHAATQAVTDGSLDDIAGMSNTSSTGGADSSTVSAFSASGNVQVGYYQWDDTHAGDSSINKGGNVQSGSNSMVQQNVDSLLNILAWGGGSQAATVNAADIGGDQTVSSWWEMYLGGF